MGLKVRMGWQDLLAKTESVTAPWTGGRKIVVHGRTFTLEGVLPEEMGWHDFEVKGDRKARWTEASAMPPEWEGNRPQQKGYVAGNRLVPDGAGVVLDPLRMAEQTLLVHLVEPGLERFARALVAQAESGAWIFVRQEFPLGPDAAVAAAYEDRLDSIDHVAGVSPALDLCFRWERWGREQAEERRRELARQEEARLAEELRRAVVRDALEDAARRRALLEQDFEAAAHAALQLSGATLLDARRAHARNEMVVRFRHLGMRFECVVSRRDLRIIDSGICLTDHDTGERGDDRFTLESLPAVIREAYESGRLVQFRHVDD